MKILEIVEAVTPVGSTTNPMAPNSLPQTGNNPQPNVSGVNSPQLTDPRLQAANLAQQKQDREKQKQALQAQIKAKQEELQMLQKQQNDLNRTV